MNWSAPFSPQAQWSALKASLNNSTVPGLCDQVLFKPVSCHAIVH